MKKIIILSSLILSAFCATKLSSQSILDVYRVSNTNLLGTGRAAGTNTTLSGIGADFTTLSSNPAGIAQYRLSEFMFSPTVLSTTVNSHVNGTDNKELKENDTKFKLPNMGLVIAGTSENNSKNSYAIGFGLNGLQSYNEDFRFSGVTRGSIIERFAALANGYTLNNLDPFEGGPAYDAGILYQDANQADNGIYYNDYELSDTAAVGKSQFGNGNGRYNELAFSGGMNFGNKFLVGATIGVPFYKYTETKTYQEADINNNVPYFENLVFKEYRNLKGTGINAKLGVMFKPVNSIIIGAAIHSPSFVKLTDYFSTSIDYTYTDNGIYNKFAESPEGEITYTIITPTKFSGSVGTIFGKYGFLNAEVEYTDFSKGRMKIKSDNIFDKDVETGINDDVALNYKKVLKVNVGGEIALPNFRIRGGYGIAQSPYAGETQFLPSFGLGFGYRTDRFSFDLAYKQWKSEDTYYPYYISGTYTTSVERSLTSRAIVATLGFKMY